MLKLGKTKSKLYLDCVSDRDEGVYTCVAETPYERITQSTEVKMGKFTIVVNLISTVNLQQKGS